MNKVMWPSRWHTAKLPLCLQALIFLTLCIKCNSQTVSRCTNSSTLLKEVIFSDLEAKLAAAWITDEQVSSFLENPNANITIFLPVDTALRDGLQQWTNTTDVNITNVGGDSEPILMLYASLEGKYSPASLELVSSINSVLGMTKDQDYVINFSKDGGGQLFVAGILANSTAKVIESKEACNGFFYKIDKMLLPTSSYTVMDNTINSTLVDQIFADGDECTFSLQQAVANISETQQWLQVLDNTGMSTPLSDPLLSSTIFIPLDQAAQSSDPLDASADSVMYNMIRGAYCPDELIAAGSKNSMLGEVTSRELPLRFRNDSGTLVISGELGSVKVISQSLGCNSVILVIDAPLYLPRPAIPAPSTLPTLPIRHLTCNPVNQQGPMPPDTSSSIGLAVGLGVGLGCLVIGVALLAFFLYRKMRRGVLASDKINDSTSAPMSSSTADLETGQGRSGTNSTTTDDQFCTALSVPANTVYDSFVTAPNAELAKSPPLVPPGGGGGGGAAAASSQLARLGNTQSDDVDLWEINAVDVQIALDEAGRPVELGQGSFGAVYRGTLRGVQSAAIKVLNSSVGSEAEAAFQREAAILKHVNRDRNVVQLYGTSKMPDGKLLLVTELMEGGDLRRALNNPEVAERLAWHRRGKAVALDIARGLTALHAVNVVHRDLKSKNVLLTKSLTAKIADVGIAAIHSQGYLTASAGQVIGTLAWSAPELLLGERCTEKVDVYSLGIVLWELATGKMPKRGFTQSPPTSERCPIDLSCLISECTDADARERPSAKEVYERLLEIPPLSDA